MRYRERSIRFWELSIEHRPSPVPNNIITTDRICTKILPEMDLGTGKSLLNFESHSVSADPRPKSNSAPPV